MDQVWKYTVINDYQQSIWNSKNRISFTQPNCLERHSIHSDLGYILGSYNHKNVPIRMGLYTYYK